MNRRARRGVALLATLWLVVAIATLTLAVARGSRTQRLATANAAESVRARAAAEAGIDHAVARLARLLEDGAAAGARDPRLLLDPWAGTLAAAALDTTRIGGAAYLVRVADAGTRLDVNAASEAELRALLRGLRVDDAAAARLVARLLDWRDADDDPRAGGAERAAYLDAEAPVLPPNHDLASLDDVRRLLGVDTALVSRLLPYLRVRGSARVNVNAAPAPVLLALPGASQPLADAVLAARRAGRRIGSAAELRAMLPAEARARFDAAGAAALGRLDFEARELELRAIGWVDGSPVRAGATALVVRAGGLPLVVWRDTHGAGEPGW